MKSKIINFLLIISSLFGYLEWGGNMHSFLFEAELAIISKLLTNTGSVLHPLTVLPLIGQIILLFTLFQKIPSRKLTYLAIAGLGCLIGLMFVIGLISLNYKIIASTAPFIFLTVVAIKHYGIKKA